MKKILITGANSYIGTSFEQYIVKNFLEDYGVDTVDLIDGSWREKSFAGYDSVFHVAGIAHQKETKENAHLYYEVNRDLAVEVAKKAKHDGVYQFIFLSSMSVYGMDTGIITKETKPNPKSNYGKSKWQAEQEMLSLVNEDFKICTLRPPMVYGKYCKGNFNSVYALVKKLPIFPKVKNRRSMIYIDNLTNFVKLCVDKQLAGVHFPQNKEYVSTMELALGISQSLGKKVYFDSFTGVVIELFGSLCPITRKAFGTLIYDMEEIEDYCIVSKMDSIKESVML